MRYKMTYILFLFFLLTTIPYIITIYINKENKKNISFENYDSGYKIQDKDQDIDLESYLLKILPGQISMDQEEETIKCQAVILRTDLIRKMGEAIGDSCQHEKLSVVLGPAVNIKRSPLCGRNFEYFSEDPYLAGEMSAAYINGVQSRNVGTSIKHFAANNQEHRRMSSSSNADERTLREIYFPAFETSVKKAQPWTVMCSYNRINGVYASENPWLLTDVLRKEWGFEGYVMSDWGAVSNRVAGVAAGLDLEMPSSGGINDARIVEAVRSGKLDEKLVDQAVERILTINFRYLENAKPETPWDMEAQHLLSADIAADCMVLLKNEGILPLSQDEEAAFIGEFAVKPRFQGGGSSHINCFKTTSALEAAEGKKVTYARGYGVAEDAATDEMIAEAVAAAKKAKVAVVFAGLPDA